jgi:hypothetical protein
MDGWMDGWMEVKAILRIAYSNKKSKHNSKYYITIGFCQATFLAQLVGQMLVTNMGQLIWEPLGSYISPVYVYGEILPCMEELSTNRILLSYFKSPYFNKQHRFFYLISGPIF